MSATPYWGDFGYDYVYALSDAIESYTKRLENDKPRAFIYRGVSLKHAVERFLYFTCVNSSALPKLYDDLRKRNVAGSYTFKYEFEYFLAQEVVRNFCRSIPLSKKPLLVLRRVNILQRIRLAARDIYGIVHNAFNQVKDFDNHICYEKKVFVYVVHDKFIRFFKPVTDRIGDRSVYFHRADPHVSATLRDMHLPAIALKRSVWRNNDPDCGYLLVNFRYLCALYDALYDEFNRNKPQLVLVPEGNAPDYEVINQVCRRFEVPVVCIQNGWAPYIHVGFRNLSYSKMFVWGKGFAELLQSYNPEQSFTVTGNHLISGSEPKSIASAADKKGISFFLQSPSQLISQHCWSNFIELIKWVAANFSDVCIYIREHPSYRIFDKERKILVRYPNIIFTDAAAWTLDKVMNKSAVSVAIHSSTILESIASGVLPVIYNETPMPTYFPDVGASGAGIEVKTLQEAKDILNKLLNDVSLIEKYKHPMAEFSHKFFQFVGNEALNNIIDELEKLFADDLEINA